MIYTMESFNFNWSFITCQAESQLSFSFPWRIHTDLFHIQCILVKKRTITLILCLIIQYLATSLLLRKLLILSNNTVHLHKSLPWQNQQDLAATKTTIPTVFYFSHILYVINYSNHSIWTHFIESASGHRE